MGKDVDFFVGQEILIREAGEADLVQHQEQPLPVPGNLPLNAGILQLGVRFFQLGKLLVQRG